MSHTEERYLRAAKSSHLVANEYSTDIDSIIAAGSSGESLASSLLRLRGEYDAVRSAIDHRQRLDYAQAQEREAKRLEAIALVEVSKMNRGPTLAQLYRGQAASVRKDAAGYALSSHKAIISRLKTLPIARMLLRNYVAQEFATTATPNEVDHLVRSLLQSFLVPRCSNCGGRGFNGGHRNPTVRCAECRESGRITIEWGNIEFEQVGHQVLYRVEIKCESLRRHLLNRTRAD